LAGGIGLAIVRWIQPSHGPVVSVIAVLPFENVGDTAAEYYADGMTDELSSELATIPSLRVVSRTSVYAYKGKHPRPQELARALHADEMITGTLRRFGDRVRVTAELSSTASGLALWSYTN